jgi:tellurite methyltransferase
MKRGASIDFFDRQFGQQLGVGDFALNPFEMAALPYLQGRVLDFGCGLGNLSIEAARRGCQVVALDASETAIAHLRQVATELALPIDAVCADLRDHALSGTFDAVVSIGLLMFLDCDTARARLRELKACVRPGGVAVVNVLVEGTTYLDMFDADAYCLFGSDELKCSFVDWDTVLHELSDFQVDGGRVKRFATIIARRDGNPSPSARELSPC